MAIAAGLALTGCMDADPEPNDDGADEEETTDDGGTPPETGGEGTGGEQTPEPGTTGEDPDEGTTTDDSAGEGEEESTGEPAAGTAMIRVIHGSAEAPNVDIYVEGIDEPVISDLPYGGASNYLEVPAGDYNFLVRAAGAAPDSEPAFETGALTLPDGATISALASGRLGSEDEADRFRVLPLVEDFDAPGDGQAIVRVVHAGADAPTVDIDVGNDGTPEIEGLARFADIGAAGVPLPAETSLQIGISVGGETVTAFTTPELPAGAELFVIATGLLSQLPRQDAGFSLLAVSPAGTLPFIRQNPSVFAFHASPDAPAVDICVGDTALLSNVPFGALGGIQVPPGEYDLEFHASPSDCTGMPASTQATPPLEAGERYLAVATGELDPEHGDPEFSLAAFVDDSTLDADPSGVVRVLHLASAPAVDVGIVADGEVRNESLLVEGIEWPNRSDELVVPAGTYDVGVLLSGTALPSEPAVSYSIPIGEGARALALAVGAAIPDHGEQPFSLYAIDKTVFPWAAVQIPAN